MRPLQIVLELAQVLLQALTRGLSLQSQVKRSARNQG